MRRFRYALLVCVVIALVAALAALSATSPRTDRAARATPYAIYWLGTSFDGLRLSGRIKRLEKPDAGEKFGADFTTYLYGACKAEEPDGGCTYPAEIQSWNACKRNLSVYTLTPDGTPLPRVNLKIRGVPAALFEDGTRLEVYTGRTTIVIFGTDLPRMKRAAQAAVAVNDHGKPGAPLPAPAPGALQGKLAC
jgi:hypothetical protein